MTTQQPANIHHLLWFAFFAAIGMYNVIAILSIPEALPVSLPDTLAVAQTDPMVWAVGCMMLGVLGLSAMIAHMPIATQQHNPPLFIIRFGLAEVPSVLGLVLVFTTSMLPFLWVGSALSAILLIMNRPPSVQL